VLTPEFLPVPAVDGGGVETILNDFLDINAPILVFGT